MERMEKKPKKRLGKDFVGELSGKPTKRDYVGLGKPNTKKIKIKDDKSDFAGKNKAPKAKTTSAPTSFGQAFSQARKKLGAGKTFTYKGKKYSTNRADDKKKTKTVTNVVKPKLRPKVTTTKKPASKMGIDGAASTVKKKTNGKTGLGSKTMSTKTKKTFKGTNITPTKSQKQQMRKRMIGST